MEERCLNKFLKLFDKFYVITLFVAMKITNNDNNPLTGIENLTDDLIRCGQIYEEHEDWNMLYTATNEVKQNLWRLSPDNRILYLKSIIRKFADISTYTNNNYTLCVEDLEHGACSKRNSNKYYPYLLQIKTFLKGEPLLIRHYVLPQNLLSRKTPLEKQTIGEQYISLCARTLYHFECELGRICEVFDINFMELQENTGIYLREWNECEGNYSFCYFELSHQTSSTKISSTLTIGKLTVEQTESLFALANDNVFIQTSIENFVKSLNDPNENTLVVKTQDRATVFFNYWDKYGLDDNNKTLMIGKMGDVFLTHYTKRHGESRYTQRPLDTKKLDAFRSDLIDVVSSAISANSPAK